VEQAHPSESERAGLNLAVRSVFIDQAMRMLGVSKRTVYYRIREGRLRTIRVRGGSQRVLVESIQDLVATGRPRAVRPPASSGAVPGLSSQTYSCR
jgi:excisionase family DNA binding protein